LDLLKDVVNKSIYSNNWEVRDSIIDFIGYLFISVPEADLYIICNDISLFDILLSKGLRDSTPNVKETTLQAIVKSLRYETSWIKLSPEFPDSFISFFNLTEDDSSNELVRKAASNLFLTLIKTDFSKITAWNAIFEHNIIQILLNDPDWEIRSIICNMLIYLPDNISNTELNNIYTLLLILSEDENRLVRQSSYQSRQSLIQRVKNYQSLENLTELSKDFDLNFDYLIKMQNVDNVYDEDEYLYPFSSNQQLDCPL